MQNRTVTLSTGAIALLDEMAKAESVSRRVYLEALLHYAVSCARRIGGFEATAGAAQRRPRAGGPAVCGAVGGVVVPLLASATAAAAAWFTQVLGSPSFAEAFAQIRAVSELRQGLHAGHAGKFMTWFTNFSRDGNAPG